MINQSEKSIFWAASFATPVLWFVLGIVSIFELSARWLTLVAVAFGLSAANLWGYIKCARGNKYFVHYSFIYYLLFFLV